MDQTISILTDAVTAITNGPAWLLVIVFIIAFGYGLKSVPLFPNQYIPIACTLMGTILLPLLGDPGTLPATERHPHLVFALLGFVMSMLAWLLHAQILARVENHFGLFQGAGGKPTPIPNPPPADPPATPPMSRG